MDPVLSADGAIFEDKSIYQVSIWRNDSLIGKEIPSNWEGPAHRYRILIKVKKR